MAKRKFKAPEIWVPGIYNNVPFEAYLAIDAVNSSFLKSMMRSPAHAIYDRLNPKEDTAAKRVGRIVHAGVLEPARFKREYVPIPDYANSSRNKTADGHCSSSPATKWAKTKIEEFEARHKGQEIISRNEEKLAKSARKSLMGYPLSCAVLDHIGPVEQTILWHEEVEVESFQPQQVLCKIRPDKWLIIDGELIVVDIKTTVNAAPKPNGFWKEIDKYRYDIQAAMYLLGFRRMAELGLIPPFTAARFVLLAVEKEGLFACHPHEMADAWIEIGERDFRKLLALHQQCTLKGEWPLWGLEASIAHPPHYRINEYTNED